MGAELSALMARRGAKRMEETDMVLSGLGLISVASASLNHPSTAPFHALDAYRVLIWCPITGLTLLQKQRKYGLG